MEKPKKKPTSRKKWLIGVGLLLTIAVIGFCLFILVIINGIAGVSSYFSSAPNYDLSGEEARDFIEQSFFPLPENARDVYLYYFSMQDFEAYIRFSASPEAIETWLSGLEVCFDNLDNRTQIYNTLGEELSWWKPNGMYSNAAIPRCEAELNLSSQTFRQISIDERNPELWIIYLVIFST